MDDGDETQNPAWHSEVAVFLSGMAGVFASDAALGDLYEIEVTVLALRRSRSEKVRNLARSILGEHRQTAQRLQSTLKTTHAEAVVPYQLDARRRGLIDHLEQSSQEDFEDRFLQQQKASHEEALEIFRQYEASGENEALRAFARITLPFLQKHLNDVCLLTD